MRRTPSQKLHAPSNGAGRLTATRPALGGSSSEIIETLSGTSPRESIGGPLAAQTLAGRVSPYLNEQDGYDFEAALNTARSGKIDDPAWIEFQKRIEKKMREVPDSTSRDWISYGIPPRLSERFQRTGKGMMFELPAILNPEGTPHFVRHREDGSFTIPTLPVTAKALAKHAKRFGPDGVMEAARAEGVALDGEIASRLKPGRHTTADLERWVLRLCADGMLFAGVAKTTNVGIGRVRAILRKHGVEMRRGATSLQVSDRAQLSGDLA